MKKKLHLIFALWLATICSGLAQTTAIKGLAILVKYSDSQNNTNVTQAQLGDLINKESGVALWNNTTSVKEYYRVQSNNKVDVTAEVVEVTLNKTCAYYHAPGANKGQEFVEDVAAALKVLRPAGFTGLTMHPTEDRIWFFSMFFKMPGGPNVCYWVDPVSITNNGVSKNIRHVAVISSGNDDFEVNTVCHEFGHHLMAWTDYYYTQYSNLGGYCVMASAGTRYAPMPVSPPLRYKNGWTNAPTDISGTVTQTYTLTANSYTQYYRYVNPNNPKEHLAFSVLKHGGYYQPAFDNGRVPDQGLAIWYVDEDGGFEVPNGTPDFYIKLIQADNKDEMHDESVLFHEDVRGDLEDLFDNTYNTFPNSTPFRWKDGGEFGISISEISPVGSTMSFKVTARPNTVLATSDLNGTISPKGVLSAATGSSQIFTLVPNIGYQLDVLKVNGVAVTATNNSYTLSNISGTKTISATFKKKTSTGALPSPWLTSDIGTAPAAGTAIYENGKFYLESFGDVIDYSSDNFRFVYQTLNGDGSIVAKLTDHNKTRRDSKSGIMIRKSLSSNSVYSMVGKRLYEGVRVQERLVAGENPAFPSGQESTYLIYKWLKIERTGNVIKSYCSKDNFNWVLLATETVSLGSSAYVGLYTTRPWDNIPSKAIFDSVSVSTATVSITSPQNNAAMPSIAPLTINASATDRNGTIAKVDFYAGTTLIGTDNTAPFSITWNTPSATGKTRLIAKATDYKGGIITSSAVFIYFPCSTDPNLTGAVIGTSVTWGNGPDTKEKVFDGDITTFLDSQDETGWAGLDLGAPYKITGIKFYPRYDWGWRMGEGKFQGSNTADFSSPTDLYTIAFDASNDWYCVVLSNQNSFRYVRYISPAGGHGNVAEVEFHGTSVSNIAPAVSIASPANNTTFNAPASITVTANATDADGTVAKVEFYKGGVKIGEDVSSPYSFSWTETVSGTYSLTAKTIDNGNLSTVSSVVTIIVNSAATTDICLEAESASLSGLSPYQVMSDPTAAGGNYIVVPNGPGNQSSPPVNSIATLGFNVATAGTYNIWLRVIAPTTNDNDLYLKVDNASYSSYTAGPYTSWTWKKIVSKSLTVGSHTISVARKEDGLKIDKIILTISSTTPTGFGCGASARMEEVIEAETESPQGNRLILAPNPSSVSFSIVSSPGEIASMSIINAWGAEVHHNDNLGSDSKTEFGNELENGVYTVIVKYQDGQTERVKIVKTR